MQYKKDRIIFLMFMLSENVKQVLKLLKKHLEF